MNHRSMPLTEQQEKDFLIILNCARPRARQLAVQTLSRLRADLEALQAEIEALQKFKASVDEALNSGDGAYRP